MTIKYIFHNFTDKPFTGYWNGKAYTFKPGIKKQYVKGIVEHFAKHLTNEILTASKKEAFCSPKKPLEVPAFMKIFNKIRLYEEVPDEDNLDIAESGAMVEGSSMNIKTQVDPPAVDPYDANAQPAVGPGSAPQVIGDKGNESTADTDGGDESNFDGVNQTKP